MHDGDHDDSHEHGMDDEEHDEHFDDEHYDIDHHHDEHDIEDYGNKHGDEAHDGLHLGYYNTNEVDAGGELCFFEDLKTGNTFRLEFEVIRGGEQDIAFNMKTPDGQVVHHREAKFNHPDDHSNEAEGHYNYPVQQAGVHSFCFDNEARSEVKTVSWFVHEISGCTTQIPGMAKSVEDVSEHFKGHLNPVVQSLVRLGDQLDNIERTQHHMRTREHIHRDTGESTNSRVMWISSAESLVLVLVTVVQILYIRNWFSGPEQQRRRVV